MQDRTQDKGRPAVSRTEAVSGRRSGAGAAVRWDDSAMRTTYSNFCHVVGTREEITLLFGTRHGWEGAPEVGVRISDRIILNPHAAKRLALLLGGLVIAYEKRFGPLGLETPEGSVH